MTDDGWLTVQQVADYAGVSGSMVRGTWCGPWEQQGLAKKILNESAARQEWRIHPNVLERFGPLPAAPLDERAYNAAIARGDKPGPPPELETELRQCRLIRGDLTIEGQRITVKPDGTIVVE